jgi:HlyD family secretion protein
MNSRHLSSRLFLASAALALTGLLAGCGSKQEPAADAEPVTPVQTATAKLENIDRIITADAVLYPIRQSSITPKITAPIRRFLVNRGDHVHQGQLLAELENRDLLANANEAKAMYEQAQSQFVTVSKSTVPEAMIKARTDVDSARQALDAAKTLYQNRVALVREGALAQKLADDAKVALVQAQSLYDTTDKHLQALQNFSRGEQIKSAQSQVDAANARYMSMKAQVSYAQILSPISGIVADRPSYVGEMASAGAPIITIVNISEIVARANVPENDQRYLTVGDAATVASPEGEITGKVSVISPAVNPSSTTAEIWVMAPNKGEKLRPGETAKVTIHAETIPNALVVPVAAVLPSEGGGSKLMVVKSDSTVEARDIETGVRQGEEIQIVRGLKPGEAVVTVGGIGLNDKAKVKVEHPGQA